MITNTCCLPCTCMVPLWHCNFTPGAKPGRRTHLERGDGAQLFQHGPDLLRAVAVGQAAILGTHLRADVW